MIKEQNIILGEVMMELEEQLRLYRQHIDHSRSELTRFNLQAEEARMKQEQAEAEIKCVESAFGSTYEKARREIDEINEKTREKIDEIKKALDLVGQKKSQELAPLISQRENGRIEKRESENYCSQYISKLEADYKDSAHYLIDFLASSSVESLQKFDRQMIQVIELKALRHDKEVRGKLALDDVVDEDHTVYAASFQIINGKDINSVQDVYNTKLFLPWFESDKGIFKGPLCTYLRNAQTEAFKPIQIQFPTINFNLEYGKGGMEIGNMGGWNPRDTFHDLADLVSPLPFDVRVVFIDLQYNRSTQKLRYICTEIPVAYEQIRAKEQELVAMFRETLSHSVKGLLGTCAVQDVLEGLQGPVTVEQALQLRGIKFTKIKGVGPKTNKEIKRFLENPYYR